MKPIDFMEALGEVQEKYVQRALDDETENQNAAVPVMHVSSDPGKQMEFEQQAETQRKKPFFQSKHQIMELCASAAACFALAVGFLNLHPVSDDWTMVSSEQEPSVSEMQESDLTQPTHSTVAGTEAAILTSYAAADSTTDYVTAVGTAVTSATAQTVTVNTTATTAAGEPAEQVTVPSPTGTVTVPRQTTTAPQRLTRPTAATTSRYLTRPAITTTSRHATRPMVTTTDPIEVPTETYPATSTSTGYFTAVPPPAGTTEPDETTIERPRETTVSITRYWEKTTYTQPYLLGDLDKDGDVTLIDYFILYRHYYHAVETELTTEELDRANIDRIVFGHEEWWRGNGIDENDIDCVISSEDLDGIRNLALFRAFLGLPTLTAEEYIQIDTPHYPHYGVNMEELNTIFEFHREPSGAQWFCEEVIVSPRIPRDVRTIYNEAMASSEFGQTNVCEWTDTVFEEKMNALRTVLEQYR